MLRAWPFEGRRFCSGALNLVDRYILREWLKIFGLVLLATLGLLLMQALFDDFSDLLAQQAKILEVLDYFAVKMPAYFAVVLPLALLLSLLYALGQLHRNNEITALRAAGAGLFRITRVIWLAGLGLCAVVWYFNASLIPWSVEESRAILDSLHLRHQEKVLGAGQAGVRTSVTFDNPHAGRMWFFDRYSQVQNKGYGVTVVEYDRRHRETTRLLAREAWRNPKGAGWIFHDGREIWLDPDSREVVSTKAFAEQAEPFFGEDPALMFVFDLKPVDLSFTELERIIDHFTAEENPKVTIYLVRYYGLLADAMMPLIVIVLAVPFAVGGVRTNPAVGVSKSLGLFLLYFLLVKTCYALGGEDVLPPVWAALLPNLAMLGLGGWFFARVR